MNDTGTETAGSTSARNQDCICGGKGPAVSAMLRMMAPADGAGEHFRNAGVEFLKGLRDLIDQRIQTMSEAEIKGTKLNVE